MRTKLPLAFTALLFLLPMSGCWLFHGGGGGDHKVRLEDDSQIICGTGPVNIAVLDNDTIGSKVTITSVTIPTPPDASFGTAEVNPDNSILFTPVDGATGETSFEYQVNYDKVTKKSTTAASERATVTVYLRNGEDSAPVAEDFSRSADPGETLLIDALANVTDPDSSLPGGAGLVLTNAVLQGVSAGEVAIVNQQIQFIAAADFNGSALIDYTVTDSCGNSDTGTVTVNSNALITEGGTSSDGTLAAARVALAPAPALVLLVNNSNFEVTVSVGGQQVDVVQPLGSTVVPAAIASGDQSVAVEALLPAPAPARQTSSNFTFAPEGRYTITYTDDNVSPAAIGVKETP